MRGNQGRGGGQLHIILNFTLHYHLVVRIDAERVDTWSARDVVKRWQRLFSLPEIVRRWQARGPLSPAERELVDRLIAGWRERLKDLGWFMRTLNEPIARHANWEDNCTGRFWEGRYKSQALLDEKALLTCMAYVDLNPIRAHIAKTPESSNFTSIQARIEGTRTSGLVSFRSGHPASEKNEIPYAFPNYLALVDWTGRALREDKNGAIGTAAPPILDRLNIPAEAWLFTQRHYRARFFSAVGPVAALKQRCARLNQHWLCGPGGVAASKIFSFNPARSARTGGLVQLPGLE